MPPLIQFCNHFSHIKNSNCAQNQAFVTVRKYSYAGKIKGLVQDENGVTHLLLRIAIHVASPQSVIIFLYVRPFVLCRYKITLVKSSKTNFQVESICYWCEWNCRGVVRLGFFKNLNYKLFIPKHDHKSTSQFRNIKHVQFWAVYFTWTTINSYSLRNRIHHKANTYWSTRPTHSHGQ